MQISASSVRFGQMFVGENGKVIVLEPKRPETRGLLLHESQPGSGVHPVGSSPVIDIWTRVIERFGRQFRREDDGFQALGALFRADAARNGILGAIPPQERQNAQITLTYGALKPFNGGLRLDYPA